MKLWIKIVPNGQPSDGEGTWLEVDFVPVPAADGQGITWQIATPITPGFRIVAVNEDGPSEKRLGGGGN